MLIYHSSFDIYHCIFRVLRVLTRLPLNEYEINKIRIIDFYLIFPDLLQNVRFPRQATKYKAHFSNISKSYERIGNQHRIFAQLEPYQKAALRCMASYNLLDTKLLKDNKILLHSEIIPTKLLDCIKISNEKEPDLINFLTGPFFEVDLYGDGGLKARTKLLEYRYDPK